MEANVYFEGLETSYYRSCIEMLEDRYNKCITPNRGFVEE